MAKTRKNSHSRRASRRASRVHHGGEAHQMHSMPPSEVPAMAGGKVKAVGTRAEVMHGTAHHTSGGLTKAHLKYNKHGRIVSRKASERGKKSLKHLVKAGYKAKKGTFRLFKKSRK